MDVTVGEGGTCIKLTLFCKKSEMKCHILNCHEFSRDGA